MRPIITATAVLAALCALPATAQREISSFKEVCITNGNSYTIDGTRQSDPYVYFVPKDDGTWQAVRLTVAPSATNVTDFSQPYLNNATPTSIQVNWKTNAIAADEYVAYGTSPETLDKTVRATTSSKGSYHWNSAEITGLLPDHVYYYRVTHGDRTSITGRFHTPPEYGSENNIRILVIGDHQRNEHSDYEWLINAAKATVAEKYGPGPIEDHIHFLLNDGDQVDAGRLELYDNVHLYKSRFISPFLPNMTVVGNHEYKEDPDLANYSLHFGSYGNISYRGITSGDAGYYAYQAGTVLVVALNSDDTANTAQKMWLRRIAAEAAADPTVKFIVSVQHRPLYAEQYCYDVSTWARNEIMPILDATGKHMINIAGHHHLYSRGQLTDTPLYHIITGGGVGTSAEGYEQMWGITPDNLNQHQVQKTIDHWTYQILEFNPATGTMTAECYSIGNSRFALDNEIVDSFSRTLHTTNPAPAPQVEVAATPLSLPHTFSYADTPDTAPYTVQYQIAATPDFKEIIHESIVNAEDFYGMTDNYRPLDINKGIDITRLTIHDGTIANGSYYIRSRSRDSNLNWTSWSTSEPFTIEGATDPAEIIIPQKFYHTSSDIVVSFTGATPGSKDWIGIYREHHKPGTADLSYRFEYTNTAAGSRTFSISEPGAYFAAMFKDDGYTEISPRRYFVVTDHATDANPPVLTTDKLIYAVGDPIHVSYTNAPCISNDWIGLYDHSCLNPVDGKSLSYTYATGQPDGTVTLNIVGNHNYTSPAPDGIYYVNYAIADRYYEPAERTPLIIGRPVILSLSHTQRPAIPDNDTYDNTATTTPFLTVAFEGAPAWAGSTINIINTADTSIPVASYPVATTGGSVDIAPLPEGEYTVVMTADNLAGTRTEISPRLPLTITGTSSIAPVTNDTPVITLSGRTLTVSSATSPINTIEIFSTEGTLMAEITPDTPAASLTCRLPYPAGIYLVRLNGAHTAKLTLR